jgi:lipopolysaccharide transport system ATP-binding protein
MSIAIKAENLSKAYQIGEFTTGTISRDIERWWALARGKEDPFLKIGETNVRSEKGGSNMVWSLKDLNFEVRQGEALGIIGKNGAGKSTLLKVLSQVTTPTRGTVKMKGRVASLLEVGTGFHPELTGRENIFLNGAILGMTKSEVKKKFDEIVDFSGVERYIDTPVKRYSSGMYVRLAFAVAAHLDSEILIVDEVLAVGDAEFQKKCIGKMGDISKGEGRTILFVSHVLSMIKSLCKETIILENGTIRDIGTSDTMIREYLSSKKQSTKEWEINTIGDHVATLISARITDSEGHDISFMNLGEDSMIEYSYRIKEEGFTFNPNIHLFDQNGNYVFVTSDSYSRKHFKPGVYISRVKIPGKFLNTGIFTAGLALTSYPGTVIHFFESDALTFEVKEDIGKREHAYTGVIPGVIRPELEWKTERIEQ